ncbi:uncharacterized protein LOC132276773 isoform X2 [Cornus florida]|uniref:uncharacterized protein LOC132276773 isoform X2 n=1 Tax=Cornus florida TaxID=4283 RepID=UPI002899788C|nr:uncharacterized protein LOC132276773 isoform X2 [Cornus florida]
MGLFLRSRRYSQLLISTSTMTIYYGRRMSTKVASAVISSPIHDGKRILKMHDGMLKWTNSLHDAIFNRHDATGVPETRPVVADRITQFAGGSCPGGVPETCPGNEGREYFLRRILSRAVRYGMRVKIFSGLVNIVVKVMGDVFPELKQHELHTRDTIEDKEASFGKTFLHTLYSSLQSARTVPPPTIEAYDQYLELLAAHNRRRRFRPPSVIYFHHISFARGGYLAMLIKLDQFDPRDRFDIPSSERVGKKYMTVSDFMQWTSKFRSAMDMYGIFDHCGKEVIIVVGSAGELHSLLTSDIRLLPFSLPPPGWKFLNTDGAYRQGKGAGGYCCRDHLGDVEWQYCFEINEHQMRSFAWVRGTEAFVAEALCVIVGSRTALRYGIKWLFVYNDCLDLVELVNKKREPRGWECLRPYRVLVSKIISVQLAFKPDGEMILSHVNRELNTVADFLAGEAIRGRTNQYDREEVKRLAALDLEEGSRWMFRPL